jgi:hypothetical protein
LQLLNAARADAARRKVHHAQKAGVVMRVLQQAQISQRVLDLGALEKPQAAVHPVGMPALNKRGLHHPALRIAAVKQAISRRSMPSRTSCAPRRQSTALRQSRWSLRTPAPARPGRLGAQVLAQAAAVVADQRVGRIEDVAEAAVIAAPA